MVAGVAGGLGAHFGVDPLLLRLAFVVLGFASAAGVLLYALLWAVMPAAGRARVSPYRNGRGDALDAEHAVAVGLITLGTLLLLARLGVWFPPFVWPLAVVAVGLGLVWTRTDEDDRRRWRSLAGRLPGRPARSGDHVGGGAAIVARAGAGIVLLLVGVGSFFATTDTFTAFGQVGIAMVVTAAGVALLLGPWIMRLWRQLGEERRQRIRSEERADLAAHLHDSVLQTLVLIQRRAESPQETVILARRQERELRSWLYGDRSRSASSLVVALDAVAAEVEDRHQVTVEVVTVGDCDLDDRMVALVSAAREALVNAARHSGGTELALYVECEPSAVTAYVRDRGRGFRMDAVGDDRRGIADSIVGRMERHGGRAEINAEPGSGTEVVLTMPPSEP